MSRRSEMWKKMETCDGDYIHLSRNRSISKEELAAIVDKDLTMYRNYVRPIRKKYKKKKKNDDSMRYYHAYAARCENYIICLLAHLNGISTKAYFTKTGQQKKGLLFKENGLQGRFTDLSYLNWDLSRTYVPYDLEFKLRFITILMSDMKNHIEDMIKSQMLYKKKKKRTVIRSFELIDKMVDTINFFVKNYLLTDDYGTSMIQINDYITYGCTHIKNPKGFNREVSKVNDWLSDNLVSNGLVDRLLGRVENQDAAIYNLILLSFKVITQSSCKGVFPDFKKFEGKTKDDDLRKDISMLGKAIRKTKKYDKRSILYKAWNDAHPAIYSNYEDVNEKTNFAIGLRALMFTGFMLNNRQVQSFIYDMIAKPSSFKVNFEIEEEKEDE